MVDHYLPYKPKPHKPNKGLHGGACNREACQDEPAYYFNSSTRKYYCGACARLINEANMDLTKGVPLCTIDPKDMYNPR